jgi:hypothetical protein
MFDPHRTRRYDKRYYTRKGQVIQASRVNTKPIIEQRLVPVYKDFLIKNGLVDVTDVPHDVPTIDSVVFSDFSSAYPIKRFNLTTSPVTISGKSQALILNTSQRDRNYWEVTLIYLSGPSATYTIPASCRYRTWVGQGEVNDSFQFLSNYKRIIEIGQRQSMEDPNAVWIQTNFIHKSIINFSDVPA